MALPGGERLRHDCRVQSHEAVPRLPEASGREPSTSRTVRTALRVPVVAGAAASAHADSNRALLDLATCHGSTLPAVADFPVRYLGVSGYGIFKGPNLVLRGAFDEVREALADEAGVDRDDCRADGLPKVCTGAIAANRSRLTASHPTDPAERTVPVCVEDVADERG